MLAQWNFQYLMFTSNCYISPRQANKWNFFIESNMCIYLDESKKMATLPLEVLFCILSSLKFYNYSDSNTSI
jgi:hypothetical protein